MLKHLRQLSIVNAMILLAAVGAMAVTVYAGSRIREEVRTANQLYQDAKLTELARHIGALTHALQRERGSSTGFTASQGERFGAALQDLRGDSDHAISALNASMQQLIAEETLSEERVNQLNTLSASFDSIQPMRDDVDAMRASRQLILSTYTTLNHDAINLLSIIGRDITYTDASHAVLRHAILMTAKDTAGLERAIGSAGFAWAHRSRGPFPRELYTEFEALISQQTALMDTYHSLASPEMSLALRDAKSGIAASAVFDIRDIVRSFDPREIVSVSPESWFSAATAMIDDLKTVEDLGALEISAAMSNARTTVSNELRASILELGLILSLLCGGSMMLTRLTTTSLRRATSQVKRMVAGDIDTPIAAAQQSDLNAMTTALEEYRCAELDRRARASEQRRLEESAAEGIRRMCEKVGEGDFAQRLRLEGLTSASLILGNGINEIMGVAEASVREQRARDTAELERREAESQTQAQVVSEISHMVQACSDGQFDARMNVDGLEGAWREVADGINKIACRTGKALSDLNEIMDALQTGDLSRRLEATYSGMFEDIAEATNASLDQLQRAFVNIQTGVHSVGSAAAELRAGTGDLAKRSEDQAQAVYDSAAVTQDLSSSVAENAKQLTECRKLVAGIVAKSTNGQRVSSEAISSITVIEEASSKMVRIVGTIDEIAFQTNLLALNASVEAARAGDAGKGFGVVASEVRALAARCGDASQQIAELINEAVHGVKEGAANVRETGDVIGEMRSNLDDIERMIETVFSAGSRQEKGVEILNASIMRVEETAQSNAALAQENNSLMASLAELEGQLSRALSAFSVSAGSMATPKANRAQAEKTGLSRTAPSEAPQVA